MEQSPTDAMQPSELIAEQLELQPIKPENMTKRREGIGKKREAAKIRVAKQKSEVGQDTLPAKNIRVDAKSEDVEVVSYNVVDLMRMAKLAN